MVLSGGAVLPILWELFPDHPNLLPAAAQLGNAGLAAPVRKPMLGAAEQHRRRARHPPGRQLGGHVFQQYLGGAPCGR